MIEWGPEIAVDGKRPGWLGNESILPQEMDGDDFSEPYYADFLFPETWEKIPSIRLPADHPVYTAIAKGFTPWGGGDEAPEDWDGGEVLLNDPVGVMPGVANDIQWTRNSSMMRPVIGYRRRKRIEGTKLFIGKGSIDPKSLEGLDWTPVGSIKPLEELPSNYAADDETPIREMWLEIAEALRERAFNEECPDKMIAVGHAAEQAYRNAANA